VGWEGERYVHTREMRDGGDKERYLGERNNGGGGGADGNCT